MYDFFIGKIAEKGTNYFVLCCGGVGYFFNASTYTLNQIEDEKKVFAYLLVREDEMSLFGFATKEEREMFKKLISVSGIGPKVAMNILCTHSAADLAVAVITADEGAFKKVSGVGAKSAQRIILELKGKIELPAEGEMLSISVTQDSAVSTEAIMALMSLGYEKSAAAKAVAIATGSTADELIFDALKRMGGAS